MRQRRGQITYDNSLSPPQKPKEQKPYQESPSSKEDEDTDHARLDLEFLANSDYS